MEFPYQFETHYRDWFPILPVSLVGAGGRIAETTAYLDSGAAFNVFKDSEAAVIGLKLTDGRRRQMTSGDGRLMTCHVFLVTMIVGGQAFRVEVGFSRDLKVGVNILGLAGFFDQFREVAIRHRSRSVILHR